MTGGYIIVNKLLLLEQTDTELDVSNTITNEIYRKAIELGKPVICQAQLGNLYKSNIILMPFDNGTVNPLLSASAVILTGSPSTDVALTLSVYPDSNGTMLGYVRVKII